MNRMQIIASLALVLSAYAWTKDSSYTYEQACMAAAQSAGTATYLRVENCSLDTIRTAATIKKYISDLFYTLKQRTSIEPMIAHYEGPHNTGYSFIMQSEHVTCWGRFNNHSNSALIYIFSKLPYNPPVLAELTKKHFQAQRCTTQVIKL